MAQIHVRIDERPDPDTGRPAFIPVIAVDERALQIPPHPDAESAIADVEKRLEGMFEPGRDVVVTYGRWFVTLTEVVDKLRFLFAVNAAPALPGG
jgi:hypothetical protein